MPRPPTDALKAFLALRSSLEANRAKLLNDIAAIDQVLGSLSAPTTATPEFKSAATAKKAKRAKNELSLRDAVIQAIGQTALSKEDILAGVKKLGYKFSTQNPANSLNTLLYGKKSKFKSIEGKFSLA